MSRQPQATARPAAEQERVSRKRRRYASRSSAQVMQLEASCSAAMEKQPPSAALYAASGEYSNG